MSESSDPTPEPPLVVVRAFWHPWEAQLARSALWAAGIEARLADEFTIGMYWPYAHALGGVKVLVRAGDAAAASDVLDEAAVPQAEDSPEGARPVNGDETEAPRCPRCGSPDLETILHGRRAALAATMLLDLPLLPVWRRTHCHACGHAFRAARRAASLRS